MPRSHSGKGSYKHGPAKGPGWGGPAKGAGTGGPAIGPNISEHAKAMTTKAAPFTSETAAAAQAMQCVADRNEVLRMYTAIMRESEFEANRMAAGAHLLNRIEGTPIARNLNVNTDDIASLSDADIHAELARLGGTDAEAAAGAASTGLPQRPVDVVH